MRSFIKGTALAAALLLGLVPLSGCAAEDALSSPQREEYPAETPAETLPPEAPQTEFPVSPPALPETNEPPPEDEPPASPKAPYIEVLVDELNVRAGAGMGYAVVGRAEKGTLLKRAAETEGWFQTEFRGKTAYVSANERYTARTELPAGDEMTEKIIEVGLSLLGTPYVYGAVRRHDGRGNINRNFTTSAFDCSSLMQYMFYEGAGILLDVTTRTQIKQGEKVEWGEFCRGDLFFFTNASRYYASGIERVGHVALYLGENYILHTASDYAKIEPISAKRWDYFLEARRVR